MPIIAKLGIDPVHFGLVMVLNLMIGLLTPPVGMVLFVLQKVARISFEATTMAVLPWLVAAARHLASSPTCRSSCSGCPASVLPSRRRAMAPIRAVEILQVDLAPKVVRTDAIQSFVTQETPIVRITLRRRRRGRRLHATRSAPAARRWSRCCATTSRRSSIGRDPDCIEAIWKDLFFHTHATAVGAITSLALAAIDTALWDLRCKRAGLPLWKMAGGAQPKVPVYTTEGGWLHLPADSAGRRRRVAAKAQGFRGAKLKVGKPHVAEDVARLARGARGGRRRLRDHGRRQPVLHRGRGDPPRARVRAVRPRLARGAAAGRGPGRARRARRAHARSRSRSASRSTTRRTSASTSSAAPARSCRSTARASAASRRGSRSRISRRPSTSPVCPHFLMELHVSLTAAVPNAAWVEYIPQLDAITTSRLAIADGYAHRARRRPGSASTGISPRSTRRAVARGRVPH